MRKKKFSAVETLITENKVGSLRPPINAVKNTFSMKNLDAKCNNITSNFSSSNRSIKYQIIPNSTKN